MPPGARRLIRHVHHKVVKRVGDLRTGGDLRGIHASAAAEQALGHGPADIVQRPLRDDGVGVEADGFVDIIALVVGVALQDGGQLLYGDGSVGAEGLLAVALDDAFFGGPFHGVGVPGVRIHIAEGAVVADPRLILQAVEGGDDHGAAEVAVGGELLVAHAVHQAFLHAIVDGVMVPQVQVQVGEVVGGAGLVAGALVVILDVGDAEPLGLIGDGAVDGGTPRGRPADELVALALRSTLELGRVVAEVGVVGLMCR